MKVTVDPDRCQGHARCWEICPEVFSLDEVGHAVVASGEVPSALEAEVTKAAANCPERAITVSLARPQVCRLRACVSLPGWWRGRRG